MTNGESCALVTPDEMLGIEHELGVTRQNELGQRERKVLVRTAAIVPTQPNVDPEKVQRMVDMPARALPTMTGTVRDGQIHLKDGHHRLARAKTMGERAVELFLAELGQDGLSKGLSKAFSTVETDLEKGVHFQYPWSDKGAQHQLESDWKSFYDQHAGEDGHGETHPRLHSVEAFLHSTHQHPEFHRAKAEGEDHYHALIQAADTYGARTGKTRDEHGHHVSVHPTTYNVALWRQFAAEKTSQARYGERRVNQKSAAVKAAGGMTTGASRQGAKANRTSAPAVDLRHDADGKVTEVVRDFSTKRDKDAKVATTSRRYTSGSEAQQTSVTHHTENSQAVRDAQIANRIDRGVTGKRSWFNAQPAELAHIGRAHAQRPEEQTNVVPVEGVDKDIHIRQHTRKMFHAAVKSARNMVDRHPKLQGDEHADTRATLHTLANRAEGALKDGKSDRAFRSLHRFHEVHAQAVGGNADAMSARMHKEFGSMKTPREGEGESMGKSLVTRATFDGGQILPGAAVRLYEVPKVGTVLLAVQDGVGYVEGPALTKSLATDGASGMAIIAMIDREVRSEFSLTRYAPMDALAKGVLRDMATAFGTGFRQGYGALGGSRSVARGAKRAKDAAVAGATKTAGAAGSAAGSVGGAVTGQMSDAAHYMLNGARRIKAGVTEAAGDAKQAVGQAATAVQAKVASAKTAVTGAVTGAATATAEKVGSAVRTTVDRLTSDADHDKLVQEFVRATTHAYKASQGHAKLQGDFHARNRQYLGNLAIQASQAAKAGKHKQALQYLKTFHRTFADLTGGNAQAAQNRMTTAFAGMAKGLASELAADLAKSHALDAFPDFDEHDEPEMVHESAIRVGGKIYTGRTHAHALRAALHAGHAPHEMQHVFVGGLDHPDQGYVTSHGRFLNRREAYDHAKTMGQLRPGVQEEHENSRGGYGGLLDSGDHEWPGMPDMHKSLATNRLTVPLVFAEAGYLQLAREVHQTLAKALPGRYPVQTPKGETTPEEDPEKTIAELGGVAAGKIRKTTKTRLQKSLESLTTKLRDAEPVNDLETEAA